MDPYIAIWFQACLLDEVHTTSKENCLPSQLLGPKHHRGESSLLMVHKRNNTKALNDKPE